MKARYWQDSAGSLRIAPFRESSAYLLILLFFVQRAKIVLVWPNSGLYMRRLFSWDVHGQLNWIGRLRWSDLESPHRNSFAQKMGDLPMLKKLLLTGGVLTLLSSVTLGVPLLSYARCGASWLRDSASEAMPLEWELKRARQMISDLKPEIHLNAKRIAQEKVQVARLDAQLQQTNDKIARARTDIERLTDDLRGEQSYYTYAGKTYTSVQVKTDLGNRFKRFKTREATVAKLSQMLQARQHSLSAARERMDAMLSAKRQLEVEVENLQARLGALRVAQTTSELNLDDSQLSRTRELLDEIATRMDVVEETMSVDSDYFGEINLEETESEDIIDEITVYFAKPVMDDSQALVSIDLE